MTKSSDQSHVIKNETFWKHVWKYRCFLAKASKKGTSGHSRKNHLLTLKLSSDQPMSPRRPRPFLSTWLIHMSNPGLPVLQKIENYKSGLTMAFEIQGAWFSSQKRDFQKPIVTSFRDEEKAEFQKISKHSFSCLICHFYENNN